MKNIILFLFCFVSTVVFGQIESIDYLMKYNCETNHYDVSIIVLDGSASSIPDRAQFNAQISIVVPTGEAIVITNKYMPLQSNQNYSGTAPMDWSLSNPVYAPEAQPESDFYSIVPKLTTASFYNDLEVGDVITLFSFVAGTSGQFDDKIRFYKNGVDPLYNDPGMAGGDFSNGFCIGGAAQLYHGNVEKSCVTDVDEQIILSTNVFPNPFDHKFSIEFSNKAKSITILGSDGKVYYTKKDIPKGVLLINSYDYPSGVYYLRMETENGITSKKIIKY